MGDSADNYTNTTESAIMIKRQMIRAEFYNTYDVMTGVRGIILIFLIERQSTYVHTSQAFVLDCKSNVRVFHSFVCPFRSESRLRWGDFF